MRIRLAPTEIVSGRGPMCLQQTGCGILKLNEKTRPDRRERIRSGDPRQDLSWQGGFFM